MEVSMQIQPHVTAESRARLLVTTAPVWFVVTGDGERRVYHASRQEEIDDALGYAYDATPVKGTILVAYEDPPQKGRSN
jgi:hypothetical protein